MRRLLGIVFTLSIMALTSVHAEPTQAERAACQQDAFRLCTHAIPDRDRVRSCLRQNMRKLSVLCQAVLKRSR